MVADERNHFVDPEIVAERDEEAAVAIVTDQGCELITRDVPVQAAVGQNWSSEQIDALVSYTKQFAQKGGS